MINTFRSEWIKFRTVLVHWILVIIAFGFPVVIVTLVSFFSDIDQFGISSSEAADLIVGLTIVSAMLLGTTTAISLTSEYSHNTIRPTYAATPNRFRVLAAKLALSSVVAVAVSAATVATCWIVVSTILSSRDNSISLGDDDVVPALLAVVALALLVSWFGFALGLIIRNSPATVSILLLWPLLIEGLIGLLFFFLGWDGASDYLPYGAALNATSTNVSSDALGRPEGQLLFGAVCVVLLAVGATLDRRRDA